MKALSIAAAVGLLISAGSPALAAGLDDAVMAELNFARTHPSDYARELRETDDVGAEDPEAVDEAIAFLRRQSPLPPLRSDNRLAAAAMAHTAIQGPQGRVGHDGSGGLGPRLQRHGVWAGLAAENISYGYRDPRDVIRQLVVDSGVPGRGHRTNIFGRAFQAAGVACGPHSVYGSMCVIDFAGAEVKR
ncbi:MAG TPA: CAP domain-containing protein [Phenylobacterium sp.]|nr:CAP domain-containing protein [Phenylobacterium sp.]